MSNGGCCNKVGGAVLVRYGIFSSFSYLDDDSKIPSPAWLSCVRIIVDHQSSLRKSTADELILVNAPRKVEANPRRTFVPLHRVLQLLYPSSR